MNILNKFNPYIGHRAYVIGPLMIMYGTQLASVKLLAMTFTVCGLLLMISRPFAELGKGKLIQTTRGKKGS
ncbi:hypothetical protein BCT32_10350 [Vibrio sp. 10N.261.45.E11]|nr:hypothetical protein BCT34_03035 [Vibrio sp. 10N.261.45.E2]PMN47380.1 hypothetical protein BCT32_10350 [Vibrio sp. 10N.261.45.E11]